MTAARDATRELRAGAELLTADLERSVVPYWAATHDRRHGGFLLADEHPGRWRLLHRLRWRTRKLAGRAWRGTAPSPREKHLVGQSRVVIALALASRAGRDPSGTFLTAAIEGSKLLRAALFDRDRGGFFWCADRRGRRLVDIKCLCGQAFAILALVELGRATRREELFAEALALFRLLHERLHDPTNGGWCEHADRHWRPLTDTRRGSPIDRIGCKSLNTHVHVLEALAELADATGDDRLIEALEEAHAVCERFFPTSDGTPAALLSPSWSTLADPGAGTWSVGHLLEFAWLSVRAHEVMRRPAPTTQLLAAIDRAVAVGFDQERGGFGATVGGDGRMLDGRKEWWVQAEGVVALVTALRLAGRRQDLEILRRLLRWIVTRQRLADGVWVATTDPAGRITNPTRAGSWKAGYHEVRALLTLADALRDGALEPGSAPP